MKTLDLPAASSALPISSDPAEFASSSNAKTSAQNFDELMGHAMATNEPATETADSETPVENDAPASSTDKTKTSEPASTAAAEMIAAMILPAVLPTVAITTTASTSAQDVIEAVSTESDSQAKGEVATDASSETAADASALNANLPDAALPLAAPKAVAANPATTSNTALSTPSKSPHTKASAETPLTEIVAPSTSATTSMTTAPSSTTEALIPTEAAISTEAPTDSTTSQPADPTADQPSIEPISAEQKVPSENISTANQLLARNNAPIEAAAQAAEAVESTVDPDAVSKPANASPNAISASGTSGAKYRSPMQKAEKQNEFAESAEQKLPVGSSAVAGNGNAKSVRAFNSVSEIDQPDASSLGGSQVADSFSAREVNASVNAALPANPARAVERTQDLMALHAFRLRDSGQDSMQVVIKPSPDLHLALNLQIRDGQMEVSAHLQRGDYEFLNRHWTDLQQQLEARGVRLAPLSNNESTASNGNFSQHSGRQSSEEKAAKTGAFAEFALASVLAPKRPLKFASVPQGWESWA
jgi:hypothetical protein